MPLILLPATPQDAPRIAEIHMAAFGSNLMLRTQFPSPTIRAALQIAIEQKLLADIEDLKTSVLVVRDVDLDQDNSGKVISFAKWSHPVKQGEHYVEPPWIWPQGTDLAVLEEWGRKVEKVQESLVGTTPAYHLSFIGTDPTHARRGAATWMVRWGVEHAIKNNVPAYLESTIEAAPFYEKTGFTAVGDISLMLEGTAEEKGSEM